MLDIIRRITWLIPTSGDVASWLSVTSEAPHVVFVLGY